MPALTWVTSAHAVEYTGARAVFADVDLRTYNLDPMALEGAISSRTKAVVVVHLFGLAADLDPILAIARRYSLRVIEDAACAVGTTYGGQPVGGFGDVGCFSFHPRKIITTGEGGMMTTNDEAMAERLRVLRNHGAQPGDDPTKPWCIGSFDGLGWNQRMTDIQAAIGIAQMMKLASLLGERGRRASRYTAMLRDGADLVLPVNLSDSGHTYQSYVVRILEGGRLRRNIIMESMARYGIQTRPGTHAVHRLGYYRNKYKLRPEDFPNAAMAEDTTITLPIFYGMSDADQDRVVEALRDGLEVGSDAYDPDLLELEAAANADSRALLDANERE